MIFCQQLTAPSIHEPHCQSALAAAVENLSSSAQSLMLCSRPLVEKPNRHGIGHQMSEASYNLAKALDRLKDYFSNINGKLLKTYRGSLQDCKNALKICLVR